MPETLRPVFAQLPQHPHPPTPPYPPPNRLIFIASLCAPRAVLYQASKELVLNKYLIFPMRTVVIDTAVRIFTSAGLAATLGDVDGSMLREVGN